MFELMRSGQETIGKTVDSLLELYPEYRKVMIERGQCRGIMLREQSEKVSVIVGAGSGNSPWCYGYVGKGLADGAVVGPMFTAPTARGIQALTRAVSHRKGVVYICANYAGDVLNFELASELVELDGIRTGTVAVTDDIGSGQNGVRMDRRGTAGVLLVVKTAGGAAALGMDLEDVLRIAVKANENIVTLSVNTSSIKEPQTGRTLLYIEPGMVSYGAGFNGEKGLMIKEYVDINDTVDTMLRLLLAQIQPLPAEEIVILINGFAYTSDEELLMAGRRVIFNMRLHEIKVHHILFERAFSLRDASGFSISIMTMDDELLYCYEQPAWSPFIHSFTDLARTHSRLSASRARL